MKAVPRKCSATTRRGAPCRRWATRASDPPLCPAHGGRQAEDETEVLPGSDLPAFPPEERDGRLQLGGLNLDEEIALARLCLLRVAEALEGNGRLTPEQRIRLASLIFRGTSTVARLLRDRQAVVDEAGDNLSAAVTQVVNTAASELEVEL